MEIVSPPVKLDLDKILEIINNIVENEKRGLGKMARKEGKEGREIKKERINFFVLLRRVELDYGTGLLRGSKWSKTKIGR